MKIAILRNTFLPPSETFIYNQIKSFKNLDVRVLAREVINRDFFDFENLEITSVVDPDDFQLKQKISKFFYTLTRYSSKFDNYIKRQKNIQLIHAHFGVDGVYALPLSKRYNIPLVTTFHGMDITRLPKFTLYPISWFNYYLYINQLKKHGQLFIAVSKYIKKRLIDEGFPAEKIKVHYIGIDVENIPLKSVRNDEEITILTVGRLTEKKGTIYLIKAFEKLYKKNKNISLVVIGDGPLKEQLQRYAKKLDCNAKIIFKGQVTNQIVIQEMLKAHIFCLPSITASDGDQEGLGMVLLEAAATGLPVVASNSGGIPDAVIHRETGFLVREKAVDQLAEKIQFLIEDKDLREKMGFNGRKNVEDNFNLRLQSQKLEEIYKELVN